MNELTHSGNAKSKDKGYYITKQAIIDLYKDITKDTEGFILYEVKK